MPAGNFTPSAMPGVLLKQREIYNKGRINSQRGSHKLHTAFAVLENQTARTTPLMEGRECKGVAVAWIRGCDKDVIDNEDTPMTCEIGGTELESVKQTNAPNIHIYRDRVVTDKQCNDLYSYEDKLAEALLSMKQEMEEELNQRIHATISGNVSPSTEYEGLLPYGWSEDGDAYVYPSDTNKKEQVLSEMFVVSEINRIDNPIIIGDGTWKASTTLAKYLNNNGGAVYDEAGLQTDFGKWYFDPTTMNTLGSDYGKLFVVDPANIVVWTLNEYDPGMPKDFGDGVLKVWAEPSMYLKYPNGQPVYFDALMKHSCIMGDNGMPRISTKIRLVLRGGVIIGPGDCSETDTGILYMKQDNPAES